MSTWQIVAVAVVLGVQGLALYLTRKNKQGNSAASAASEPILESQTVRRAWGDLASALAAEGVAEKDALEMTLAQIRDRERTRLSSSLMVYPK